MRKTSAILALCIALSGPALAQEVVTPVPAIEQTIQSQINAFLADDFATAFTFASPGIQNMFRTPENFGAMVRNGYPMVWRPRDVTFGDLRDLSGALWQEVILTDQTGQRHVLAYQMEQRDGVWRIAGVQILPQPEVAA